MVRKLIRSLLTERIDEVDLRPPLDPVMPGELPRGLAGADRDLSIR
jgi:hypothetical protein